MVGGENLLWANLKEANNRSIHLPHLTLDIVGAHL